MVPFLGTVYEENSRKPIFLGPSQCLCREPSSSVLDRTPQGQVSIRKRERENITVYLAQGQHLAS